MCQALRFILFVPKTYGLTCAVYVLEPKAWKLYYALKYMAQNPNTTMCFVFCKNYWHYIVLGDFGVDNADTATCFYTFLNEIVDTT